MGTRSTQAKTISAIVCSYNRYDALPDALASLMQQSLPRSAYEIIVVDNSSDLDAQSAFWESHRKRFAVKLELSSMPGLSRARNRGVALARAPLVAFCDDDAVVSPNWLETLVDVFESDSSAGVCGGPVIPIWPAAAPAWLPQWLAGFFTIVDLGSERRDLEQGEWLAGTNIAFRRQAIVDAGGFDETLGRRAALLLSNEEIALVRRLRDRGVSSVYEPHAVVHHKVHVDRVSQAWLRRRVSWQAISDALTDSPATVVPATTHWDKISDYVLKLPPEMRTLRGLFLDTEDPATLQRQCDALAALLMLMLTDPRDPEAR